MHVISTIIAILVQTIESNEDDEDDDDDDDDKDENKLMQQSALLDIVMVLIKQGNNIIYSLYTYLSFVWFIFFSIGWSMSLQYINLSLSIQLSIYISIYQTFMLHID